MYLIENCTSSLIESLEYWHDVQELTIKFKKYFISEITYYEIPISLFNRMLKADSLGRFYLSHIKSKYKSSIMADKPKSINESSDQTRFIKMSINVKELKKEWLIDGKKGVYANITLFLKPNGEIDQYGNLGMITQDVPDFVYKKESKLPKDKRTQGPILGNGIEFAPKDEFEGQPGSTGGTALGQLDEKKQKEVDDDLPF